MIQRRTFLRGAGAALAAPFAAQVVAARRVFAAELEATLPPEGKLTPKGTRPLYTLDPAVIYLNHASIGTIPQPVQAAHQRYLSLCETNPWYYMWSTPWEEARGEVRTKAATLLGCGPDEVAIPHNTTEAFNLLAQGLPLGRRDEVLFSSLNHAGASACWHYHAEERGYRVRQFDFPVHAVSGLSEDAVLALYDHAISRRTRVLVLPHVDNTVGLRHPIRKIATLARARGVKYIAVDGAQSVGMLPVDVASLGVDVYATSPHKWLQAPKGLGLLYLRREIQSDLRAMWVTWGQERWKGSVRTFEDYGTRNLPAVLALGDAIDFQTRLGATAKEAHHQALWRHARQAVDEHPGLVWRSPTSWVQSAALYAVEVTGQPSREVAARLFAEHGFVVRPFDNLGLNVLRLSPNVANTRADLDRLFSLLG